MSSSYNDRQKELNNVIKQSNVKTDEFIERENVKLRQFYEDNSNKSLLCIRNAKS